MFASNAGYTGVSVKRFLEDRGVYAGKVSGISMGPSAVRLARESKSESDGGSSSS